MRHRRVNGVDNLKRLRELAASKLKELAGLGESNGQAYEANDWDTPVVVPSKDSSDWDNKLAQLVSAKQQGKQLGSVAKPASNAKPASVKSASSTNKSTGNAKPVSASATTNASVPAKPKRAVNSAKREAYEKQKKADMYAELAKIYGYTKFRTGQYELISSILDGRDVLGVLPTGGGKSLCFQLPTHMIQGMGLVITPLISLMRDQVEQLNKRGYPAAFINSQMSQAEVNKIMSDTLHNHRYKILYVAPERLDSRRFVNFAVQLPISVITVDEAHCVSMWGKDFRPAYLRIPEFVKQLPSRPVIAAFTATATPQTRQDIISQLDLHDPYIGVTTFDRPNLRWYVRECTSENMLMGELFEYARRHKGCGIIFRESRAGCVKIAKYLASRGVNAQAYHAGMKPEERTRIQEAFISGEIPVIVSTSAFGMGIDKPDVRWVLHANVPKNLEEYYQEAGRAGRDGKVSHCVLYWRKSDFATARRMLSKAGKGNEEMGMIDTAVMRFHLMKMLDAVEAYCEATPRVCLRNVLLDYFGEHRTDRCGQCSTCHQFEKHPLKLWW